MRPKRSVPTHQEFLAKLPTACDVRAGTPEGDAANHLAEREKLRGGSPQDALKAGWHAVAFMMIASEHAHRWE